MDLFSSKPLLSLITCLPHCRQNQCQTSRIGPLQDPVTWYGINYTGTQMTQWDFQNKGTLTSPARLSFVLKVPLRHLRPSVIYSVPCDWILQMVCYRGTVLIHDIWCMASHILKMCHQASFERNVFKLLAPSCFIYVCILLFSGALRFCSR